jgi:hypothetical protein
MSTGGCAQLGLPFEAGSMATGGARGLVQAAVTDGVDPSDWEAIRQTLAGIGDTEGDLNWRNPKTGSTGTLTAMNAEPRPDRTCRAFATTISDLRGVRRYSGEACLPNGGRWQFTGVVPDDTTLL